MTTLHAFERVTDVQEDVTNIIKSLEK